MLDRQIDKDVLREEEDMEGIEDKSTQNANND